MEIERKFLVSLKEAPLRLEELKKSEITQGYLAVDAQKKEVRVRRKAGKCFLTIKSGKGLSRDETEVEISKEQFEALIPAAEGCLIEKTRYAVPLDGLVGELDVYGGKHEGLAVIEVEFPSETAATNFQPPEWFGEEKTDDEQFKNAALARAENSPI